MSFIALGQKRFALPIGETVVGGTGDRVLPFRELSGLRAVAVVLVTPDNAASLWPEGDDAPVTVNGRPLGNEPVSLAHGSKIDVAGMRLLFGDLRQGGTTMPVRAVTGEHISLLADDAPEEPTAATGGRLTPIGTGIVIPISDIGLVIGRDADSDVVVSGLEVSRRHAVIRESIQGYVLSDISTNGTYVNRARVNGARTLGMGDVIRIGDAEFRFDADAPSTQPTVKLSALDAAAAERRGQPAGGRSPSGPVPEPATEPRPGSETVLATLEVIGSGALEGSRYRIERGVAHVGRGSYNDVRLCDPTVSGSHATLTQRGASWIIVDHQSTNGTYVDGKRVVGAREFSGAVELRFGNVRMAFRPTAAQAAHTASPAVASQPADAAREPRHLPRFLRWISRLSRTDT